MARQLPDALMLDLRGAIPSFVHISDGKLHDVNVLDVVIPEPGAFYVMDRGYIDFARLYTLHQAGAFFVTRVKSNFDARRAFSAPTDRSIGIACDQTVTLNGFYASKLAQASKSRRLSGVNRTRAGTSRMAADDPHVWSGRALQGIFLSTW
jgi:Transposase DDE domain